MRSRGITLACALSVCACTGDVDSDGPVNPPLIDAIDGETGVDGPDAGASDAAVAPTSFDPNRLLEDDQLLGGANITVADVAEFLADEGSYLSTYSDPLSGQSAAEIIVERSHAYGVSPLYMLARIQTESSLVQSGSSANLNAATGCGCPDNLGCNPDLAGFGNQIECAAMKLRGYYDDLDAGEPTIAGWNVGLSRSTLDPCDIVPENKATAALYTYTPWVGAYTDECGRQDVGGSSLVALIYYRFVFLRDWQ